jgi:hypothetical protein
MSETPPETFFCNRCGDSFYAAAGTDRTRPVLCGECSPWSDPGHNILYDLALAARAARDNYPGIVAQAQQELSDALARLQP